MFSAPVRRIDAAGNTLYEVKVSVPPMGIKVQLEKKGKLVPDTEVQKRFEALRTYVLTELAKEKSLFRNAPTFASLDAITPVWGFLRGLAKDDLSPTTYVNFHTITESMMPCWVDLQLTQVSISRSSICPVFLAIYRGPISDPTIDFDWSSSAAAAAASDDLEEISDVPVAADGGQKVISLSDPVAKKAQAKAVVREAFLKAEEARAAAQALADEFLEEYDLSDSESAFSEWMSDEEN